MYSKSKNAVRKVKSYLDQLVAAQKNIAFEDRNPSRLAYRIREGIFASQFFLDTKKYSNLNSRFRFRLSGTRVVCEIRDILQDEFDREKALEELKTELVLSDIHDTMGIISACIKHKVNKLVFPEATSVMQIPLEAWANKNNYRVTIFQDQVIMEKVNAAENSEGSS